MKSDFEIIKKLYGEKMAKLCRELFPTLLETEGLLAERLQLVFAPSRNLYDDLVANDIVEDFRAHILAMDEQKEHKFKDIDQTPEQLMALAGYNLYECKTNADIAKFKKYYTFREQLCTFNDLNRLDSYRVFFAVKKDVDKINRKDFAIPQRQDEYGTSVISLQFSKGIGTTLSIKNRYNHSVKHCDATFSNNLENIYPGLTDSFYKYYGIDLSNNGSAIYMDNYVLNQNGQFYRYNQEIENIYFCENNFILKDSKVYKLDKNQFELIDYFIVDKKNKKVTTMFLDGPAKYDAFLDELQNLQKIEITKAPTPNNRYFTFTTPKGVVRVEVNLANQIVGYTNENVQTIGENFLEYNRALEYFYAPNVLKIDRNFLRFNDSLKCFDMPCLLVLGCESLADADKLKTINAPQLRKMGEYCFWHAPIIEEAYLPNLTKMGDQCFHFCTNLKTFYAPNIKNFKPDVVGTIARKNPMAKITVNKFQKLLARIQKTAPKQAQDKEECEYIFQPTNRLL